ncbi:hypothetical protein, partial [Schleiferilactobacillus harbinensis]|uniref:hypothetical protein n=1 Tax=Schleiferilactobacillus harbinensis TaxID=304207 RepID=UPI001C99D446
VTFSLKNRLLENMIVADGRSLAIAIDTKQTSMTKDAHLLIQPDTQLAKEYADYRIKNWQKQIQKLAENNVALNADAAQNKKLIKPKRKTKSTLTKTIRRKTKQKFRRTMIRFGA